MAIPKEFTEKMAGIRGLRSNKGCTGFFYRFKIEGREFISLLITQISRGKKLIEKSMLHNGLYSSRMTRVPKC